MRRSVTKWDRRFLRLAREVAGWSKDPSTKVGAVIVDPQRRVISMGFNGLPQGITDHAGLLENRDEKYERIIHAEVNAILFARQPLNGATIYTYPFQPCSRCASIIVQAGIKEIVSVSAPKELRERWADSMRRANDTFSAAGADLVLAGIDDLEGEA